MQCVWERCSSTQPGSAAWTRPPAPTKRQHPHPPSNHPPTIRPNTPTSSGLTWYHSSRWVACSPTSSSECTMPSSTHRRATCSALSGCRPSSDRVAVCCCRRSTKSCSSPPPSPSPACSTRLPAALDTSSISGSLPSLSWLTNHRVAQRMRRTTSALERSAGGICLEWAGGVARHLACAGPC